MTQTPPNWVERWCQPWAQSLYDPLKQFALCIEQEKFGLSSLPRLAPGERWHPPPETLQPRVPTFLLA